MVSNYIDYLWKGDVDVAHHFISRAEKQRRNPGSIITIFFSIASNRSEMSVSSRSAPKEQ